MFEGALESLLVALDYIAHFCSLLYGELFFESFQTPLYVSFSESRKLLAHMLAKGRGEALSMTFYSFLEAREEGVAELAVLYQTYAAFEEFSTHGFGQFVHTK